MGFLTDFANGAANMLLGSDATLKVINGYTQKYAEVKSLKKKDDGYELLVQPNGSGEIIAVTAKDIFIPEDNSSITVNRIEANMAWVDAALKEFVQGKSFAVPDDKRVIVGGAKKFL